MMKKSRIVVIVVFLAVVLGFGAFFALRQFNVFGRISKNDDRDNYKVAIVDFTKLIKVHKGYKELESFDDKISKLEQKMYNAPSSMQKMGEERFAKLEQSKKAAEEELKREMENLSGQLMKEKAALEAKFEGDVKKMESEMQALKAEAKKRSSASPSAAEEPQPAGEQMKAFTRDLMLLRERQVTARRLDLQKKAKEKIDAERERLDSELTTYESQISKENQQEKLNIQLKMQVTKDDDEMAKLREELGRLNEEESKLKEKKKTEVAAEIEKVGNVEMARIDKEVDAYKAKIDADIKAQVNQKQSSIGSGGGSTGGGGRTASMKDLQQKGEALNRSFEQKKQNMEAQLTGAQEEARRRFDAKRVQLEQSIKNQEQQLMKDILKNREKLARGDMERMEKQKRELDKLQRDRQKLYDSMLEEIKVQVTEVAHGEKLPFVVGMYVVNVNAVDLTDKVIVKIKETMK